MSAKCQLTGWAARAGLVTHRGVNGTFEKFRNAQRRKVPLLGHTLELKIYQDTMYAKWAIKNMVSRHENGSIITERFS